MSGEQHRRCWTWWTAVAALLILLYVASIGPAWKMFLARQISVRTFTAVYQPLIQLAGTSDTAKRFYFAYLDLWEPWSDFIGPVPVIPSR